MTLRGSGIHDISHVLGLCPSSVVDKLRRHARKIKEPCYEADFQDVEVDEFWSFVNRRREQKRWVWYAYARNEQKILAFHIGKRSKSACKALFKKLDKTNVSKFYTDDYGAYAQVISVEKHVIGKEHTTHIERLNRGYCIEMYAAEIQGNQANPNKSCGKNRLSMEFAWFRPEKALEKTSDKTKKPPKTLKINYLEQHTFLYSTQNQSVGGLPAQVGF